MANQDSAEFVALGNAGGSLGILAPYGRGVPQKISLPFHLTVPNPSSSTPTFRLNKAPRGFKPVAVKFATDGLSASAGVGLTVQIGDAGDTDRLMVAVDSDLAIDQVKNVPLAGFDYEYTADTDIIGTVSAHTPVAGKKVWGEIEGYLAL